MMDEEEKEEFDDARDWVRGEEWSWVGLDVPSSLATSEGTRVGLYPASGSEMESTGHSSIGYSTSQSSSTSSPVKGGNMGYNRSYDLGEVGNDSERSIVDVLNYGPTTPSTGGKVRLGYQGEEDRYDATPLKKAGKVLATPKSPSPIKGYEKPDFGKMVVVEFPCLYAAGDGVE
jgi:hypothetical protein